MSVGRRSDVHTFLRERNRPVTWAGEANAEAEPVVFNDEFLDSFVDRMEVIEFTVTSEEVQANLADQDQQLLSLKAWLDATAG